MKELKHTDEKYYKNVSGWFQNYCVLVFLGTRTTAAGSVSFRMCNASVSKPRHLKTTPLPIESVITNTLAMQLRQLEQNRTEQKEKGPERSPDAVGYLIGGSD